MIEQIQENSELIGAIAAIIQTIVVVISLIYVAIQVKDSTKSVESQTYQAIISCYAEIEARISENNETSRIFTSGCKGEKLNSYESERFRQLVCSIFNFYENLYYQYRQGLLKESLWGGWCLTMRKQLEKPGILKYWADNCYLYSYDFFEYVMSKKCPKASMRIRAREPKSIREEYLFQFHSQKTCWEIAFWQNLALILQEFQRRTYLILNKSKNKGKNN